MGAGLRDHHNNDYNGRERNTIVLRETSGPRTYHFGKTVTYVTRSGKVLDEDTVRTRVRVGIPVRVHYVGTGDNIMVDRVILDED
jgi:hypothetical protein